MLQLVGNNLRRKILLTSPSVFCLSIPGLNACTLEEEMKLSICLFTRTREACAWTTGSPHLEGRHVAGRHQSVAKYRVRCVETPETLRHSTHCQRKGEFRLGYFATLVCDTVR